MRRARLRLMRMHISASAPWQHLLGCPAILSSRNPLLGLACLAEQAVVEKGPWLSTFRDAIGIPALDPNASNDGTRMLKVTLWSNSSPKNMSRVPFDQVFWLCLHALFNLLLLET